MVSLRAIIQTLLGLEGWKMFQIKRWRPVPVTGHTSLSVWGFKLSILSVTLMTDFTKREHVHGLGESARYQRQLCCIQGPDQDLLMEHKQLLFCDLNLSWQCVDSLCIIKWFDMWMFPLVFFKFSFLACGFYLSTIILKRNHKKKTPKTPKCISFHLVFSTTSSEDNIFLLSLSNALILFFTFWSRLRLS